MPIERNRLTKFKVRFHLSHQEKYNEIFNYKRSYVRVTKFHLKCFTNKQFDYKLDISMR